MRIVSCYIILFAKIIVATYLYLLIIHHSYLLHSFALLFNTTVGLSAVILSSRDPSMTENLNTSPAPIDTTTTNNNSDPQIIDDDNDNTANNNQGIIANTNAGQCNTQDIQTWISTGGSTTRPTNSNYCSREYNNLGCLLDATCIERCFQEVYGYSDDCSVCFGKIPGCSIEAGCLLVW